MTPQVVTLGEAMLRLSPPRGVRLQQAAGLDVHVAGAESNVAVALASLGVEVGWISRLPEDPMGRRVAMTLAAAGVRLDFVEWDQQGRIGLFFVEFGSQPRPTVVWYDRRGSSFSSMASFDASALGGARYAVTSGVTPAISDSARRLVQDFVGHARESGARVCIDVNYRERLWSTAEARSCLCPLLADADVVVCSKRDAKRVFAIEGKDQTQTALELHERFAPQASAVVLTDGVNGCVGVGDSPPVCQPALRTEVVDRFGAGDAFLAGMLWGLLTDNGIAESLKYAAALGALKCTVAGDQAAFTASELRAVATESDALIR